jgi:hypothetical protein
MRWSWEAMSKKVGKVKSDFGDLKDDIEKTK